jgi:nucleoside-diphosphate kinase
MPLAFAPSKPQPISAQRLQQHWCSSTIPYFYFTTSKGVFLLAIERTFAIIKPDAVATGQQGEILSRIHKAGFKIVAMKSMRLTKEEAGGFYAVHKERPFFGELTEFMSSGKIFALVLEADGAILKWRDTMGATDPKKAAPGTIRHDLGTSIGTNCTHGSDAPETAAFEIGYFFSGLELI